jgi:hypothetical protein
MTFPMKRLSEAVGQWQVALLFIAFLQLTKLLVWIATRHPLPLELLSVVVFTGSLLPVYGITSDHYGRKTAFWTVFCISVFPASLPTLLTDWENTFFLLLVCCAVYSFGHARKATKKITVLFLCLLMLGAGYFDSRTAVFAIAFLLVAGIDCFAQEQRDAIERINSPKSRKRFLLAAVFVISLGSVGIPQLFSRFENIPSADTSLSFANLTGTIERAGERLQAIEAHLDRMEGVLPFADSNRSIITLTSHYTPFIYLVGVFHALVVYMYPPFILLLFIAIRSGNTDHFAFFGLLFCLATAFSCLALMSQGNIQPQQLLLPLIVLSPLLGKGFGMVIEMITTTRHHRSLALVFFSSLCCFLMVGLCCSVDDCKS